MTGTAGSLGLFAPGLEEDLYPGDVFPPDPAGVSMPGHSGPLIVLNHECDIAKSGRVLLAAVMPDAQTDAGLLGHIKRGRVWHGFHLDGCSIPGWVDLRSVQSRDAVPFMSALDQRLHSMTPDGRLALAYKLFQYLTRTKPPSPTS